MRHTDPRLTAVVYTDEKILPLAEELHNVPAIAAKPPPSKHLYGIDGFR
jgi:hypothetical protein